MEYFDKEYCLEVWGERACFTRPELKVERVSYDVITPSAVRAVFEAIFWKPAIRWQPTKVEVLSPIRFTNIRRNEVGAVASSSQSAIKPIFIEESRQQRNSMMLRDVRYRLYARLVFIPERDRPEEARSGGRADENPGKYQGMFERRASKGQCFNQPYLGTRECVANFRLVEGNEPTTPPIDETRDLGIMLYDMDFTQREPQAMFFRAMMDHGVINIPERDSKEVMR